MSIAVENRDGRRRETDRSRCRVAVQWNGDNLVAGAREITPSYSPDHASAPQMLSLSNPWGVLRSRGSTRHP